MSEDLEFALRTIANLRKHFIAVNDQYPEGSLSPYLKGHRQGFIGACDSAIANIKAEIALREHLACWHRDERESASNNVIDLVGALRATTEQE